MPQFQNLKELIGYCSYCQLCKKERDLQYFMNPYTLVNVTDMKLNETHLIFYTDYKYSTVDEDDLTDGQPQPYVSYKLVFHLNLFSNELSTKISGPEIGETLEFIPNHSPTSNFFLYLEGHCNDCKSYCTSKDIDLNLLDRQISPIGLERDAFFLKNFETKYRVIYDFADNKMIITKLKMKLRRGYSVYKKHGEPVVLPIYDIDFSDEQKAFIKIKTYLTFS